MEARAIVFQIWKTSAPIQKSRHFQPRPAAASLRVRDRTATGKQPERRTPSTHRSIRTRSPAAADQISEAAQRSAQLPAELSSPRSVLARRSVPVVASCTAHHRHLSKKLASLRSNSRESVRRRHHGASGAGRHGRARGCYGRVGGDLKQGAAPGRRGQHHGLPRRQHPPHRWRVLEFLYGVWLVPGEASYISASWREPTLCQWTPVVHVYFRTFRTPNRICRRSSIHL